jgi:hypothetical protein
MPLPEGLEEFEATFRAAVESALPSATVECAARTLIVVKLRVDLRENSFIDVFFNARNQRCDLTLIDRGERRLGYDNLGGWHRHPPEAPDRHEDCPQPDIEAFIREASELARAD